FNSSKKTKTNKVIYDPVNDYIERIPSKLTDNSLPSIDEILVKVIILLMIVTKQFPKPSLFRNNSSSRKTTLSHSNNVENEGLIDIKKKKHQKPLMKDTK
ncbi:23263_t:CDS:2, partial [Dentiscutata erythropus]